MSYELKKADVYDLASKLGAETRIKGSELFFRHCPYCQGGSAHDKDTFSINLENGAFSCFRSSCSKRGHFVEMARDFNFQLDFGDDRHKQYKTFVQREVVVRDPAIDYLATRGIGKTVAQKYKITCRADRPDILVFPFFDENGTLTFIKYRNTNFVKGKSKGSKEWCESNARPILFGMDQCSGTDKLVITEGQLDSLSLAEAGINNAVSVPIGMNGFTWLDNCWEWLMRFSEIVVFGDCEKGKITLLDTLVKRLPIKVKAVQVEDYLGEKDANAILQKYGSGALRTAVDNAREIPMPFIKRLADVENVDLNTLPRIYTNITEVDRLIGGLLFGQVILLTGKRGEGKSTLMSQFVAEALDQDYPVMCYSGELTDYHFKRWLDFQIAGPDNVTVTRNSFGDDVYSIGESIGQKISNWYRDKAYIYDNNAIPDDEAEMESLLVTIENAIRRYGTKLICIDNLMTAMDVSINDDLYRAQSDFVRKLKRIAVLHNVAIVLVAHPRKSKDSFQNDDVSGSADITNRVDIVMSYARADDKHPECDGLLVVTKNRLTGCCTGKDEEIKLLYSKSTKRITSIGGGKRVYGWERQKKIEQSVFASDLPF